MSADFSRAALGPLQIVSSDPNNTIAHAGALIVHVRTGEMTVEALEHLEMTGRLIRAQVRGAGAGISIVESTAGMVATSARAKQREVIRGVVADPRGTFVLVSFQEGARAIATRMLVRAVAAASSRFHLASDVAEAGRLAATHIGVEAATVIALLEQIRAAARASADAPAK